MPYLPFSGEAPIEGATTLWVPMMSAMLYPKRSDDERRLQWEACAMCSCYRSWRESDAPTEVLSDFHGWLGALWDLNQSPRRVYDDGVAKTSRASLTGVILGKFIKLAIHHREHCKLDRAKALFMEFGIVGDPVSDSLVTKAWAEFKGVSHLWLAFGLIGRDNEPDESGQDFCLKLLSLAEAYRRLAEERRILRPGDTWKVPPVVEVFEQEVAPTPLSAEEAEFLAQYFPI